MTVCLPVQRSHEPEREELEKLPVRLVEMLHMADRQCYLVLPSRNLDDESFICGCAVMRKVFERLGDGSRRPGKVKQDAVARMSISAATCSPRSWSFASVAASSRNRYWEATDRPISSRDNWRRDSPASNRAAFASIPRRSR